VDDRPASTGVQSEPVHAGVCHEPLAALADLFAKLMAVPPAERF
jgi:hypothetical protein